MMWLKLILYSLINSHLVWQSIEDIQEQARKQGITSMELCERIVDGELVAGVKTGLKKNLSPFVKTVRELRVSAKRVGVHTVREYPYHAR